MFILVDFSDQGADVGFEKILILRRESVGYDGVRAIFLAPENIITYIIFGNKQDMVSITCTSYVCRIYCTQRSKHISYII